MNNRKRERYKVFSKQYNEAATKAYGENRVKDNPYMSQQNREYLENIRKLRGDE